MSVSTSSPPPGSRRKWPGELKLIATLAVVILTGVIPLEHWPAQGLLLVIVFVGLSFANVPLTYLMRRLVQFLPLIIVLGLSMGLSATGASVWRDVASLWIRCTVSFLAGLWLIHVMPISELLSVLRRWHCPAVLIAMLSFMYRHIFTLWDELRRLRHARQAREFRVVPWTERWTTGSTTIGLLLVRAMERAERTHRAMLARGWDGHVRTLDADE